MTVNGKQIDLSGTYNTKNVLFDTGNSAIMLCKPVFQEVLAILENNDCIQDPDFQLYCSCDKEDFHKYPNITFYARGLKMEITPDFYLINPRQNNSEGKLMCLVALSGPVTSSGVYLGNQVLGDPFFVHSLVAFAKLNQTVGISVGEKNTVIYEVRSYWDFWSHVCGVVILVGSMIFAFLKEYDQSLRKEMSYERLNKGKENELGRMEKTCDDQKQENRKLDDLSIGEEVTAK